MRREVEGPAAAASVAELAGAAAASVTELVGAAAALLADPDADVRPWRAEVVDYEFGSPPTAGLYRLHRGTIGGQPCSVFLKLLRAYRHWPVFAFAPPDQQALMLASPLWRYEADIYAGDLGDALPPGLRLPEMHAIADLGDDFLALLMEDVQTIDRPWDTATFVRAAELLGRMAVRLTRADAAPPAASRVPGEVTRLFEGRLTLESFPALASDALWAHPLLRGPDGTRLRRDLRELATRVPGLLAELERLPQLMIHGDASPQNLLVPVDEPGSFVVIDWTLGGLAAVGDDLGQLLVGLAHAGQLTVDRLPSLRDEVVRAYRSGVAAEGLTVAESDVRRGLDGGLVLRSAFSALPFPRLGDPAAVTDGLAHLVEERLALTRYLVDLGLETSAHLASR